MKKVNKMNYSEFILKIQDFEKILSPSKFEEMLKSLSDRADTWNFVKVVTPHLRSKWEKRENKHGLAAIFIDEEDPEQPFFMFGMDDKKMKILLNGIYEELYKNNEV